MNNSQNVLRLGPETQRIIVSLQGEILNIEGTLFSCKKGASIYDMHPFFELLKGFIEDYDPNHNEFSFPCIHFETTAADKLCDVSIRIDDSEITIFLFDYTKKYAELNQIAQQRNESFLAQKELELKNRFLLEKEAFKNSFITNINHEIRTPLTSIIGFTEVLEKTQLTFEQEELTRIIKRESSHLNVLIDDMVDISKIESGTLNIVEERFLFTSLIDGFKETYSKIAEDKQIAFDITVDPNIQEYLIGDRTRIYQILNNLLHNAFKFTEAGKVHLSITKNYQRTNKLSLNFKIEDTGIGILEEDIPHLFERFTRFETGGRKIPGTGLGLAIVKNLVDLLRGEIKVSSQPEQGSTFEVKLPFKFQVTKNNASTPRKKKKYTLPENTGKFRILVVEDEEITQYLIMKVLIAQGTFFVDIAINGEQAIKYIERRKYDLILMDLTVSKIDGFQTTHMIRNNYGDQFISQVPIIGLSGRSDASARDKCIRAGMDDFIAKPFEQEELLYKIIKEIAKKAAG